MCEYIAVWVVSIGTKGIAGGLGDFQGRVLGMVNHTVSFQLDFVNPISPFLGERLLVNRDLLELNHMDNRSTRSKTSSIPTRGSKKHNFRAAGAFLAVDN